MEVHGVLQGEGHNLNLDGGELHDGLGLEYCYQILIHGSCDANEDQYDGGHHGAL